MNTFKDLKVWQKSMSLAENLYKMSLLFPKTETYGITDQIKRSSISIASNIAEGNSRNTKKDQIHFLYIARGSCAELETQIELIYRFGFISGDDYTLVMNEINDISRMLVGLIHSKS